MASRRLLPLITFALLGAFPAAAAAVPTPLPGGSTLILSGTDALDAALPAPVAGSWTDARAPFSDDGRFVVFSSGADGLSAEDDDRVENVYVRDRATGAVVLASRATGAAGEPAHGDCLSGTISDDGRHVAFTCRASLDPADGDIEEDVYVRDLQTAATTLASRASGAGGAAGDGRSDRAMISGNGAVVVFESTAKNLDPADANARTDVFRRELTGAQATELVSRDTGAAGAVGDASSSEPSVSDDGEAVAFTSSATNLGPNADANGKDDVYLRRTAADVTVVVSAPELSDTATGDGRAGSPLISGQQAGGQYYVAYVSAADNLGPADAHDGEDVYRRAVGNGAVVLVSRDDADAPLTRRTYLGGIDDTGTRIAFSTDQSLDPADAGSKFSAYVRHVAAGQTELLSRTDAAGPGVAIELGAAGVSGDGLAYALAGEEGGATPDADPVHGNAYLRDLHGTPRLELLARPAGTEPFVNAGGPVWVTTGTRAMSDDGMRVAFTAVRAGVPGHQVWVRDVRSGALVLASRADGADGAPAGSYADDADISGDGRRVAFVTAAALDPADTDGDRSVYVRDLEAGRTFLAGRADGVDGVAANGEATAPSLDADGSRVAFVTTATNLGDGDAAPNRDVHVRDLATGRTLLASGGSGNAYDPALDAAGRNVVFTSFSADLGGGDGDTLGDIHLRDLETGALRLVSATPAGAKGDKDASEPAISADGTVVAFRTAAPVLVGGDGKRTHVAVRDLARDTLVAADRADGPDGALDPRGAGELALSADGTTVAWSPGGQLSGSDEPTQVHVRDLRTGTTALVSAGPDGAPLADDSTRPLLSADGACVAFVTTAPLAPGAGTDFRQLYLRARTATCGATAQQPPRPPQADTTAPVLRGVKLKAGKRGRRVLRLVSSEPATLRAAVQRAAKGRKQGGRCRPATGRVAKPKRCTAFRPVGAFTRAIAAGPGRLAWNGRIKGKRLRPGRYRMVLVATDAAGNRSKPVRVAFTVKRPRR